MLLEFRAKNFKSFADEIVFSMTPAPKIQDLKYSVLEQKIARKEYKALSSAVVYGSNAAGKTNIISAMEALKGIVISGNIRNNNNSLNTAAGNLELIPNAQNTDVIPVEFSIVFN